VAGAVQQIYSTKNRTIDEQLVMRPFPVGIQDPDERQRTFNRYREEIVSIAGIAIYFTGNKIVGGATANADGVRAEFELAKRRGVYPVPVGASGFMAYELWMEVITDFNIYFPNDTGVIKSLIDRLGQPVKDPMELLDPILELVTQITKE